MSEGSNIAPLDDAASLASALRQQGESEEDIASLAPALQRLSEWKAPTPSAGDSQRLLSALAPLLTAPAAVGRSSVRAELRAYNRRSGAHWSRPVEIGRAQVGLLRPSFWATSAFIASLGALAVLLALPAYQLVLLRAFAPLLAVLAVYTAFRSARLRTLEIELSCPVSPLGLALIRLVLVLGYDVGLGLLVSLVLWGSHEPGSGSNVLALTMHWLAPLLAVASIALLFSLRLPAEAAAALSYALWLTLLALTISESQPGGFFSALLASSEAFLALLGLALLAFGASRWGAAIPHGLPRS